MLIESFLLVSLYVLIIFFPCFLFDPLSYFEFQSYSAMALFGDYVNQVNHFLASGYVEQPIVVIQLAKVKFFRGQVGLQNVMYATQMLFNPDLPEVVEFRQSMVEQGVNGTQPLFIANEGKVVSLKDDFMRLTRKCTIKDLQDNNEEGSFIIFGTIQCIVEDGGWWYSACVCGKDIYPQNGAYYCDFCLKHVTNVTPRFKIKITVEDHSGESIFLLFDREASYLHKKSCADLFTEVQRDASLVYRDTYPPIFQGLIGKKLLLKVDTKDFDSSDHGRDIIVRSTAGQLQRNYETHALYWPLQYPLLFPYGEDGYQLNIPYRGQQEGYVPGRRTRVSLREFICFRLQIREQEDGIIHKCRRLFQQFVVDCFTMIESQRLYEIRMKQSTIRGEVLQGIEEAMRCGDDEASSIGTRVILPSSFTSGGRYMFNRCQDAMAICKHFGYPDLFLTITCNPNWPEFQRFTQRE
ncbi:hypothetical protein AHAS_Ahas13G0400100 [Arachis hypogaea]